MHTFVMIVTSVGGGENKATDQVGEGLARGAVQEVLIPFPSTLYVYRALSPSTFIH